MLYNYNELLSKYRRDYQIQKAVKNKELYKIEKGIYSDVPSVHYLAVINKKYPYAVITSFSAYYYHNLTDVIPDKIYLSTDRKKE
jgi:predicted transcriptional regulator of viral defense system